MANIEEIKKGYKVWKSEKEEDNPTADLSLDAYLQEKGWNNEETRSLIAKDDELRDLISIIPSVTTAILKNDKFEWKTLSDRVDYSQNGSSYYLYFKKDPYKKWTNKELADFIDQLPKSGGILISADMMPIIVQKQLLEKLGDRVVNANEIKYRIAKETNVQAEPKDSSLEDNSDWRVLTTDRLTGYEFKDGAYTNGERSVRFTNKGNSYRLMVDDKSSKNEANDTELKAFVEQLPLEDNIRIGASLPIATQQKLLDMLGDLVVNRTEVEDRIKKSQESKDKLGEKMLSAEEMKKALVECGIDVVKGWDDKKVEELYNKLADDKNEWPATADGHRINKILSERGVPIFEYDSIEVTNIYEKLSKRFNVEDRIKKSQESKDKLGGKMLSAEEMKKALIECGIDVVKGWDDKKVEELYNKLADDKNEWPATADGHRINKILSERGVPIFEYDSIEVANIYEKLSKRFNVEKKQNENSITVNDLTAEQLKQFNLVKQDLENYAKQNGKELTSENLNEIMMGFQNRYPDYPYLKNIDDKKLGDWLKSQEDSIVKTKGNESDQDDKDGKDIVPPELEDILSRIRSRNSDSNLNYLDGVKLAVLHQMGKIDQNRYNSLVSSSTSVNDRIVAIDEIESKIYGDEQEKYDQRLASTIAAKLANAIQNPNASGSIGVIENTPPELLAEVYKTLDKNDSNFVALEKHIDNVIEQFAKGKGYYFADVTNAAQTYYGYEDLLDAREAVAGTTADITAARNHNKEVIETGYDKFGVHFDGYDKDFNLSNVTTSDAKALDKRYKKLSEQAELFNLGSLKSNSQAQQILNSIDFTDGNRQSLSAQDRQIVLDNLVKIARHNMVMTSLGDKNGQMPTAANFEEHLGQVLYAASVASDVRKGIVEDIQQFTDRQKFNDFVNKALAGGVKIDPQAIKDTVGNAVNQTNAYCYRLNHKLTGKRDAQATPVVMNLLDNIKDIDERSKGRLEKVKLNKRETQKKLLTMLGVQGGIALGVSGIMSTVTKAGANKVLGKALAGTAMIAAIGLSYAQWAKNQKKQNKKPNFFKAFTSRDFRVATYTTALGAGAMTAAATGNPGTSMVLGLAAMGVGSGYRSNKYYKMAREGGISKTGAILWGAASVGVTFGAGFLGREIGEAVAKTSVGEGLVKIDDKLHDHLHNDKVHGFFDKLTGKADSWLFKSAFMQKAASFLHIPHADDGSNSGGADGGTLPDPVIADHDTAVDLWQKHVDGQDLNGWTLDGTNHTGGDGYHLVGQDGPCHTYSENENNFYTDRNNGIRYTEFRDEQWVEQHYQNGLPDLQHDPQLRANAIAALDKLAGEEGNIWMNSLDHTDNSLHPNSEMFLYKVYQQVVLHPDNTSMLETFQHMLQGADLNNPTDINNLHFAEDNTTGQEGFRIGQVEGKEAYSYTNKDTIAARRGYDIENCNLYAKFSHPGEPNAVPGHGMVATLGHVDKGRDYKLHTPSAMTDRINKAKRELEYKSQGNTDPKPNIDKKLGMANKKPNATSQTGKAGKIQLKARDIAAIKETKGAKGEK